MLGTVQLTAGGPDAEPGMPSCVATAAASPGAAMSAGLPVRRLPKEPSRDVGPAPLAGPGSTAAVRLGDILEE